MSTAHYPGGNAPLLPPRAASGTNRPASGDQGQGLGWESMRRTECWLNSWSISLE